MKNLLSAAVLFLFASTTFAQYTAPSSSSADKDPTADARAKAQADKNAAGRSAPAATQKQTPGGATGSAAADSPTAMAKRPPLGPNEVAPPMLMTPEERKTHLTKLSSFKNIDDCKTYMAEHRAKLEARAKEQHKTLAQPRVDMCERVQAAAKSGAKS